MPKEVFSMLFSKHLWIYLRDVAKRSFRGRHQVYVWLTNEKWKRWQAARYWVVFKHPLISHIWPSPDSSVKECGIIART